MKDMQDFNILVVDDDESLVAIISEVLEDDGYLVTSASSGEEAIELFRNHRFQLVISDIRMPGMTGIELLQEVKKIKKETEVIIITSHASVETTISALRLGAYDYLLKPFEEIELISAVAKRAIEKIRLTSERKELLDNLVRNRDELEHLNSVLHKLSVRDGLTGLYNHRYFYEAASKELMRCKRHSCMFSVIFIDVDNFKEYNDSHGHPAGDEVLKKLSECMNDRLRRTDITARYGGEEFVILLPETSGDKALICAETLRKQIEQYPFSGRETQPLGFVSISMGVACYPDDGQDLDQLIHAADEALYRSKAAGRNRISTAETVVNRG